MSKRKNVLLIVVDQWRGELLPKLGAQFLRTPNIDRLSAEGVTFRHHFTQAVPCGPGRASLLTGQYLMNHRAVQNTIPLDARFTNLAHEAFYNEAEGRIEIYFRSLRSQTAMVAGWRFMFAAGERIHTEYSYKYDAPTFAALVDGTGFNIGRTWTDDDSLFAVHYLVAESKAD